jgi:hypothetical protein
MTQTAQSHIMKSDMGLRHVSGRAGGTEANLIGIEQTHDAT